MATGRPPALTNRGSARGPCLCTQCDRIGVAPSVVSHEPIGIVLSLLASASYESGYLLMTQQSRRAGRVARPGRTFLAMLLHRPLWLLAIALDGAGIVFELFALRYASLIVVAPLMSLGLIALVVAARVFLGERIDAETIAAAVVLVAGVVCVVLAAPSDAGAVRLAHPVACGVVLGALGLVVVSAFVGRVDGSAWRLAAAAAAGDVLVAIAGNEIAREWIEHPLLAIAWTAAVAVSGFASVTAESAALQRLPASRVGPIVSSVGAVAPVVLLALLSPARLSLSAGAAAILAVGLLLVAVGAFRLASTAQRSPLAAEQRPSG